jgi:hypothetical protein
MASKLAKKSFSQKHKKVLKSAVFETKFNDVKKVAKSLSLKTGALH